MAVIYAALIMKGRKAFHEVPVKLKGEVSQVLIDLDCAYLIDEEVYLPQTED